MTKIKVDIETAKRMLNMDEALDLLRTYNEKRKKRLHTFEKLGFMLMGCAMDLSEIKKRLKLCKDGEIFITDTIAGHGVVFFDHTRNGWLFLDTDVVKYEAIKKLKNID